MISLHRSARRHRIGAERCAARRYDRANLTGFGLSFRANALYMPDGKRIVRFPSDVPCETRGVQ